MAGYSVTYSVVDNATKQIDTINRRITAMRAPMERLSKQVSRFADVSGLNTIAKGFASIGRAAGSVLRSLVEIVPVLGTITGAATIAGMAKLVGSYSDWSKQLTSTADNLGMTTQQLQQFEDATRLAGGKTSDMDEALKALYKTQTDFVRGQASADQIGWLNRLGISVKDASGNLRSMADLMPEVVRKISEIKNPADRAAASAALLGDANANLVNTFRQSHQSFSQWLTDASRYTELSDKQKEQLQAFAEAQGRIATAFDHLGQQLSATLAKNFTPLLNHLSEFVEKHSPEIVAAVDRISQRFADWLAGVDWTKVQSGIDTVIQSLGWMVNHIDDIKTAVEVVAALFAAKWAIGIVSSIAQVTAALGSVAGGSIAGTGLLGALGAVAALATTLALKGDTAPLSPEDQRKLDERNKTEADAYRKQHDLTATTPEGTADEINKRQGYTGHFWHDLGVGVGNAARSAAGGPFAGVPGSDARVPAPPLGLTPPAAGQAPGELPQLPGDYSWGDYGTRANNPGNMNYARWQNAAGRFSYMDQTEGRQHTMAVYNTMEEGVADAYKLMLQKQEQHGKTIAGALSAWSTTPGYAAKVAGVAGLDPNAPFDVSKADPAMVQRLMQAQFKMEGRRGSHSATEAQILGGVALARGGPPAAPPASTAVAAAAPPATVPPGPAAANGKVDVNVTHKNPPPNTAITVSASGQGVNAPPPRVEHQEMASI